MSRDSTVIAWKCPACHRRVPILDSEIGLVVRCHCGFSDIPRPGLGDRLAWLLRGIGITEERYARLRGIEPGACGCQRRRVKLNRWGLAVTKWLNLVRW